MGKWLKPEAADADWNKVSQFIPPDESAAVASAGDEWGKVSRQAVSWDVLSKDPAAPEARIGETKAERARRERLEQEAAAAEERKKLLEQEKAAREAEQRAALARAEKIRRDAEAEATRAEREMKEAEEERNHDINRKKQIRSENEKNEDTARRAGYKVTEAEARKNEARAEAIDAEARDLRKGILTETFAKKAERVLKVVRPIALSILLATAAIAGSIFMLRLAFADVCRPSFGGGQGYTQPNNPPGRTPPVTDPNGPPPSPDGDGKPHNQGAWGWDKYFNKDGQKVEPNKLTR